eukprot:jgi/Psemu1/26682/gm1.26682_g
MRTELNTNPLQTLQQATDVVNSAFVSAQFAIPLTVHKMFGMTPGSLVFHRKNMVLLPIPVITDLYLTMMRNKRQAQIDNNAMKDNSHRKLHEYQAGDQIMIFNSKQNPAALEATRGSKGPYSNSPF